MKKQRNKIERMMYLGMLNANEAAAVVDSAAGGGEAAVSSETGTQSGGESGIDWSGVFNEPADDDGEAIQTAAPVTTEQIQQVTQEAATATAQTAAPVQQQVTTQPEATAQQQQQQSPATVQEQPAQQAQSPTPEQQRAQQDAARETWRTGLVNNYALSEDEAALFVSDPGRALPQLAANLHMRVMDNMAEYMRQVLPDMMEQQTRQSTALAEGRTAFFDAWPELKGHEGLISQIGLSWRQLNPSATREQFIEQVGPMVWNAAKLSLSDLVNRNTGGGQQQQQQQSKPQTSGYQPVPSGTGPGTMPVGQPANEFAAMSVNWEKDDDD